MLNAEKTDPQSPSTGVHSAKKTHPEERGNYQGDPGCKKVLHVINGEHFSGAERVQDHLAANLPQFGYEVSFACVKPDLFPAKRDYQSAPLYETRMRGRLDILASRQITRLIREHEFDIVHAHTPRSALLATLAAKRCQIPFVYHVHSPASKDSTRKLVNWFNQQVEKWALKNATRIVTVSDSLKKHMLSQGFADSRLVVVPNGVPIQAGPVYISPSDEFIVGTVALFRPRKGTEVLLEAVAKLRDQGVPARLLAVGPFETTEYEHLLKQKVRQLKIEEFVEWTGFTTDVASYFAKMNLFVLPSLFGEGLPMVVLEAMSHRVPVVATAVEGIPQAIRHGTDGLICKAGDPVDLAAAVSQLAADRSLCETFSESSFRRQQESFSDVSMSRKLAKIYDELRQTPL
ncbi:MAG: glycosyltransferase family 4 protein [Planctomycetota bacterium]|nr:glycosyltransferase family 4 protein [Planctomycetota bacterium]